MVDVPNFMISAFLTLGIFGPDRRRRSS